MGLKQTISQYFAAAADCPWLQCITTICYYYWTSAVRCMLIFYFWGTINYYNDSAQPCKMHHWSSSPADTQQLANGFFISFLFPFFIGMIVGISSFSSQIFSKNAGTWNELVFVEKFVSEHDSKSFFKQVILFSLLWVYGLTQEVRSFHFFEFFYFG